jgi:PKHD-type hydroxylase
MTIYIPQFTPKVEPFCIWEKAFSEEECDRIIEIGEMAEFNKGRVGSDTLDPNVRDSDIVWIEPNPDTHWIFERMAVLGSRINYDKFQVEIDRYDGFQYGKYKVDGHYDWHTDWHMEPPNPELHRKISFSVMLSDPKEYEGGELIVNHQGNADKAISLKRNKGDLVVFYSFIPHKVAPVTSGERVSLVTWALGPKFK